MRTTKQISDKYKSVCAEMDEIDDYMRHYGYNGLDKYVNPKTGQSVPGTDDGYNFSARLSYLLGQRNALEYVLNIK